MFRSGYSVSLCYSMYCLCVTLYCTTATGCQPNCSEQIYHISYIYSLTDWRKPSNTSVNMSSGKIINELGYSGLPPLPRMPSWNGAEISNETILSSPLLVRFFCAVPLHKLHNSVLAPSMKNCMSEFCSNYVCQKTNCFCMCIYIYSPTRYTM